MEGSAGMRKSDEYSLPFSMMKLHCGANEAPGYRTIAGDGERLFDRLGDDMRALSGSRDA